MLLKSARLSATLDGIHCGAIFSVIIASFVSISPFFLTETAAAPIKTSTTAVISIPITTA